MLRKFPIKKLQSDLEIPCLRTIIVKLDELSEESLSGGAIALPSFLNQANKANQAESAAPRQSEAEGKIRGTLMF